MESTQKMLPFFRRVYYNKKATSEVKREDT